MKSSWGCIFQEQTVPWNVYLLLGARRNVKCNQDFVKSLQPLGVDISDGGLFFHDKLIQLLNYWKEIQHFNKDA